MIKARSKKISLLLVLMMLATMFVSVGTASAKSVYSTDRVVAIADNYNSTTAAAVVGATITIKEDADFLSDFSNNMTFKVKLPDNVKWVTAGAGATTVSFNGVAGVLNTNFFKRTDQIIEITTPAGFQTVGLDRITIVPGIEVVSGSGDVALTIDGMDSAVTSGSVVFATIASGKTSISVSSTKKIGKTGTGGVIEVRENAVGSIGSAAGNTLTLKLPSNFEWNGMAAADISMAGGFAACAPIVAANIAGNATRTLTITFSTVGATAARGMIYITPQVKASNDAAKNSEVIVSMSGTNAAGNDICDTDATIATYVDYGTSFEVKTVKDLKAGKFNVTTDTITIKENIAGTLLQNRDVNISLPSWVKITRVNNWSVTEGGAAFNLTANPGAGAGDKSSRDITIAGTSTDKGKIEFKLELSIQADKSGPIEATISGAGATEQKLVIANAIAPASLTTTASDVKVGVQAQPLKDMVIVEGVKEAIALGTKFTAAATNDGEITLILTEGATWATTPTIKVTEGNLEIKTDSITRADATVTIPVKSTSTTPAKITVSDVKITLDRSIPEGPIYVKLGGRGINENQKAAVGWLNGVINNNGAGAAGAAGNLDAGEFDIATVQKVQVANVTTPAPDKTIYNTSSFVIGASKYTLNGKEVDAVAASFAKNNRTYLAIRDVAHALGIEDNNIVWNQTDKTVTLIKGERLVQLALGSNIIKVNGLNVYTMDVVPEVVADRTFLPAAWVAQAFAASATYDAATQTVTIK